MKKNNRLKVFILIVLLLIIVSSLFLFRLINKEVINEPVINNEIEENEVVDEKKLQPERKLWLDNKNINQDYIGEIIFDSGLINKSFVQAIDVYDANGNLYHFYNENGTLVTNPDGYCGNDVYIWTNWKDMSYDYNVLGGSVFMDYRNSLDDQNIIIYGHHFSEAGGNDPKRIKAFTPLEQLLKQENYKDNNTLKLILDNETRTYELVYVYNFNVNDDEHLDKLQYYRTDYNYDEFNDIYDDTYYDSYIEMAEKNKLYDTGLSLNNTDKTLTLQTCISGRAGELFEICVFRQIDVKYFDE